MEVSQIEFQSIVTVSVPHDGDVVLELEKFAKEKKTTVEKLIELWTRQNTRKAKAA